MLSCITVEPVLFLYMITSYMYSGSAQDLIYTKVCMLEYKSAAICSDLSNSTLDYVQATTSSWIKYTNIAMTIPSVLTGYYLGSWSDKFGRKTPILIPIAGAAACNLFFIFAAAYSGAPLYLLVIGNFVQGMCGGYATVITSVMSYMGDISSTKNRTSRIAILESMTFSGGIIGYFLNGALLPRIGHAAIFLIQLAIDALIVLYVLVRVRDVTPYGCTEGVVRLQPPSWGAVLSPAHIKEALYTFVKRRPGLQRLYLGLILGSAVVVLLASACEQDVTYLFTRDDPLQWSSSAYNYYSGAKMALGAIALVALVPLARRYLHPHDTLIALAGFSSKVAGLAMLGASTNTSMMCVVPVVGILSSVSVATIRAMLSKTVQTEEQGKLFSVLSSVESLTSMSGSLIFNTAYTATRTFAHGFVFWLAAGFMLVPISVFIWLRVSMVTTKKQQDLSEATGSTTTTGYTPDLLHAASTPINA